MYSYSFHPFLVRQIDSSRMARRMHFACSQVALTHVADRARPDGLNLQTIITRQSKNIPLYTRLFLPHE
jgi:hypothetical protein